MRPLCSVCGLREDVVETGSSGRGPLVLGALTLTCAFRKRLRKLLPAALVLPFTCSFLGGVLSRQSLV